MLCGNYNEYRHTFKSRCPNNDRLIEYQLKIQSSEVIMVEDIISECQVKSTFHEPLADALFERFGGVQELTAFHHGVHIRTVRR
jgi:hypothetical protein